MTTDHKEPITPDMQWLLRNGIGIQIMETLAVGTFLVAYAVSLGASNFVIGLLAAIPHLSQLAQIPALYVIEHFRNRRRIYSVAGMVARPMLLVIGLAAFVSEARLALNIIMAAFGVRYLAGAFISCSWNSWMRDLIPDNQMGTVFGGRQRVMMGVGILLSLCAAGFIDVWQHFNWLPERYAFTVIYGFAFCGGIYSVWAASHIEEPAMAPANEQLDLWKRLLTPLKDQNFRRLLAFLMSWNFAINLATPFFTVHMLKRMELPLTWIILLMTLSQLSSFLVVSQWGRIADKMANKSVLSVCSPLFIACIFAWTFTMFPERHSFTIPLLIMIHILTGIASAGVTLAGGNITMKLAPRGNATSFMAASAIGNSIAAGSASIIGGLTADFFLDRKLSLIARWENPIAEQDITTLNIEQWDFFFLFAVIVGLYSLHRLSFVKEQGEVGERLVIESLINGALHTVRNLSSIAGLRGLTDFPMDVLRRTKQKTRKFFITPTSSDAEEAQAPESNLETNSLIEPKASIEPEKSDD